MRTESGKKAACSIERKQKSDEENRRTGDRVRCGINQRQRRRTVVERGWTTRGQVGIDGCSAEKAACSREINKKRRKQNHSPVELGVEETVAASISIALDDEALSKSSAAVVGYAAESSGAVKDRAIRDRN